MKENVNYILCTTLILLGSIVGTSIAYAGSLTPSGAPAKTMYTLSDLYTLITTGATTATTDFTTPGSAGATLYSISDLVTAFTASVKVGDTHVASSSPQGTSVVFAVPQGYYSGADSVTLSQYSDFTPLNIKSGKNIFGYDGLAGPSQPLLSGQTTCYDGNGGGVSCFSTAGQDGLERMGILRLYVDNGDGTIMDRSTGLTWQKQDDNGMHSWANALTYCNSNTAGLSGSGWRLPNIRELVSIANYGATNPAIDSIYFPSTESLYYWSSTTYYDPTHFYGAWVVSFYDGAAFSAPKSVSYHVRCVRN